MKSNYFDNHICFTNFRGNGLARNEKNCNQTFTVP